MFESVTYPSLFAIISKWCPEKERSKMVSFSFSGAMIGTAIAFPLSGVIIANKSSQIFGGWVGLFYCFGLIGLVWFVLFAYFVSESPETHPTISKKEMEYIVANRGTRKEAGIGSTWSNTRCGRSCWLTNTRSPCTSTTLRTTGPYILS